MRFLGLFAVGHSRAKLERFEIDIQTQTIAFQIAFRGCFDWLQTVLDLRQFCTGRTALIEFVKVVKVHYNG